MKLSRDSMHALQRHFLGALSAPARTWLEPQSPVRLAFAGSAIRSTRDGCVLDFGSVASPGEERHLVRVSSRGTKPVNVRLAGRPSWLSARWVDADGDSVSLASGDAGATLEVLVTHDAEREFRGAFSFLVTDDVQELSVRMIARRSHPAALFDFNGSIVPHAFDFGDEEASYELSITNATSVPLVVTFAGLPAFLMFEVDGRHRNGPIEGVFFERTAPFAVSLRPRLFGSHDGCVNVRTNDPRPDLQHIELEFATSLVAAKPSVRVVPPRRVRMRADQTFATAARLENWGRSQAVTSKYAIPRFLSVREWPVVPGAQNGQPGSAILPIRVAPARLTPGAHTLSLSVQVEGGDPPTVDVPVEIDVMPRRNPVLRPETIAALFALLLLTLLFVVMRGLS